MFGQNRILLLDDSGSMASADCKPSLTWISGGKSTINRFRGYAQGLNNRMGAVFEAGMTFILACLKPNGFEH